MHHTFTCGSARKQGQEGEVRPGHGPSQHGSTEPRHLSPVPPVDTTVGTVFEAFTRVRLRHGSIGSPPCAICCVSTLYFKCLSM